MKINGSDPPPPFIDGGFVYGREIEGKTKKAKLKLQCSLEEDRNSEE